MFTYDEIIKIIWFISLIIDLVIYKKFYEEIILGPLKVLLNTLQVILGICFVIPVMELIIFWLGSQRFWGYWISGILLLCFCLLQKYMFLKNNYSKKLKIIDKTFLLIGSSILSIFCSTGMGGKDLFILNCLIIIFSITIFFVTIKKESRKLDWFYLLLNYGNITFYIGWLVL